MPRPGPTRPQIAPTALSPVEPAITALTVHAITVHRTHTVAEQQPAPPARRAPIPRMPRPGPTRPQIAPTALSPVKPAITALTVHAKVAQRTLLAAEQQLEPPARRAPIPRMPRPGPTRLQIAPTALSPVEPAITALTVHAKIAQRTLLVAEQQLEPPARRAPIPRLPRPGLTRLQIARSQ